MLQSIHLNSHINDGEVLDNSYLDITLSPYFGVHGTKRHEMIIVAEMFLKQEGQLVRSPVFVTLVPLFLSLYANCICCQPLSLYCILFEVGFSIKYRKMFNHSKKTTRVVASDTA